MAVSLMLVFIRHQWWVVQGVMVVRSVVACGVWHGHAAVVVVVGSSTLLIQVVQVDKHL